MFFCILCYIKSFLKMSTSEFFCGNPLEFLGLLAPTGSPCCSVLQSLSEPCRGGMILISSGILATLVLKKLKELFLNVSKILCALLWQNNNQVQCVQ